MNEQPIPAAAGTGLPPLAAFAIAVSSSGGAGCGQVRLGSFVADGGTPAKPAAALAWEPTPAEAYSAITAIYYGKTYTLVGFTDGEIYWSAVGATPSWSRLDRSGQANVRSLPHKPVSAFLVDDDAGCHISASGTSRPHAHDLGEAGCRVRLVRHRSAANRRSPTPSAFAVRRASASRRHQVRRRPSIDGGMTWGVS
jgi:hypothetical protein